ncbi:MAG: right-handed parallel beta-helix repeat-containing protein [Acidimicrobiales bacterium]|nr:right-handed parallel beta-helix repeat-containing protein [Acidimicrobiales bacterium]
MAVQVSCTSTVVKPALQNGKSMTFFVNAVTGSDSANGLSHSKAWKSLAKVNATTFAPGDSILFAKGDTWIGQLHPLGSGKFNSPILISSYGNGVAPVINGASLPKGAAVFLENQQYWTISNIDVINNSDSANFGTLKVPGNAREGILVEDSGGGELQDITISGDSVSNVNGCFGCQTTDSHLNGGIVIEATGARDSFNGVKVVGNNVNRVSRSGIVFWDQSYYSTNMLEVDQPDLSTNVSISKNSVSDVAGDGIIVFGASNAAISANTVSNAAQKSLAGSTEAASVGIMTTRSIGTVVKHNEVFGTKTQTTDGEGIDVDLGSYRTTVEYNYSHDNQGGFVLLMGGFSSDTVVRYNLSVNDSFGGLKGIFTLDSSQTNTDIYNNTIYVPPNQNENPIFCQNCSIILPTKWSFINNIIENFGTGSYLFPGSPGIEIKANVFFGNHPLSEPYDPLKTTSNPDLISPGGENPGLNQASNYSLSLTSPDLSNGLVVANNGGEDFFGDPISAVTHPSRGFKQA